MTDITKCTGEGCHKKENCYRFTAKPDGLNQAWGNFQNTARFKEFGECAYFYPNGDET